MWLYVPCTESLRVPEREPSISVWNSCLEITSNPLFTVNAKPMPRRDWRKLWKRKAYVRPLFGTMLRPSRAKRCANTFADERAAMELTSSTADTRVNRFHSPAEGVANVILATYGHTLLKRLSYINRLFASSRTSPGMLLLDTKPSDPTYDDWVTALRQVCSRRRKLALRTSGPDFSFWPWRTPNCSDGEGGILDMTIKPHAKFKLRDQVAMWKTPQTVDADTPNAPRLKGDQKRDPESRGSYRADLKDQVTIWPTPRHSDCKDSDRKDMARATLTESAVYWPTPRTPTGGAESKERKKELGRRASGGGDLQSAAELWPTPKSRDYKGGQGAKDRHSPDLDKVAERFRSSHQDPKTSTHGEKSSKTNRRLNPHFTNWLMGWPIGWSDYGSQVTASSLNKWRLRSLAYMLGYILRVTEPKKVRREK